MKKMLIYPAAGAAAALVIGAVYWMASPPVSSSDPSVVSANGIHWHTNIQVYVNGGRTVVPANIGIGRGYANAPNFDSRSGMAGMHTHDTNGTLHVEGVGIVTRDDVKLRTLFKTWGKTFDDFGSTVIMKVNGVENNEGEDYQMKDGDEITLSFFP